MDQDQFIQRGRKLLKRIGIEIEGVNNLWDQILDDEILAQPLIDDGGEYMFKKQASELDLLREKRARLQAKRPEILLRLESAELALKASRLGASGLKEITVEMEPGRAAYTDSQGKQWPAQKPKLSSMQVRVNEEPRFVAHLAGNSQRDTPEYRAAILARQAACDNQRELSNLDQRIAQKEREVKEFLELRACADSEAA